MFFKRVFPFLLLAFVVSVLVRLPNLNRPLSKHHEFCTAVALRVLQIWDEGGIANYGFNPCMTYPNEADKYINNYASTTGKMLDDRGNYYYVSHPPLAYYIPFFGFKLFGIYPDVLAIQIFHLVVHFLSGLGVYLILCHLFKRKYSDFFLPAFVGFLFYVFNPATLWFQANTYMSDMLVQVFFIYGVLAALLFFDKNTLSMALLLGLVSFLMVNTTWFGIFFGATVVLAVLFKCLGRARMIGFLSVSAGTLAALALIIFQYSQIAGFEAYYSEALSRFAVRGSSGNIIGSIVTISKNYITSYLPLLAFIIAGYIFLRKRRVHGRIKHIGLFSFLSLFPILLLHLVLANYSGHDFTTLYAALFLSVMGACFFQSIQTQIGKVKAVIAISVVLLVGIVQYYTINWPGTTSFKGDWYAVYREQGDFIKNNANEREVIFLKGAKPTPQLIFYAHRNIRQIEQEVDAKEFLKNHEILQGVIFGLDENQNLQIITRVINK